MGKRQHVKESTQHAQRSTHNGAHGREVVPVHNDSGASVGTLISIGGHEDKIGEQQILCEVAQRVHSGVLVVATLASTEAEELWRDYRRTFRKLGVQRIEHLNILQRAETEDETHLALLKEATVVFFTGGSQLRITGHLGGTPLCDHLQRFYRERKGTIAGTSAGASVMSGTMIVSGESEESHRIGNLRMAPGLGFMEEVIIDQHFAQRGRIGRLLGAVAQNPRELGVGLDEDTAIVVEQGTVFRVLGAGAVYVLDGREVSHSNIVEETSEQIMSVFGMRLHVLSNGDTFDLKTRQPISPPEKHEDQKIEPKETQGEEAHR